MIHLKNGEEIVGYFGSQSYATSFPNDGSIYLEKTCTKDENGNIDILQDSDGILIANNKYLSIQFFKKME